MKSFEKYLNIHSACLLKDNNSTLGSSSEMTRLRLGAEVLLSTPVQLVSLINKRQVDLSRLQTVVLDEVDVMFLDESFPLQALGTHTPNTTQFVFATATLPQNVQAQIAREFPDVCVLRGPGLHRVSPSVLVRVLDCGAVAPPSPSAQGGAQALPTPFQTKTRALLLSVLYPEVCSGRKEHVSRIVVFCNEVAQCQRLETEILAWARAPPPKPDDAPSRPYAAGVRDVRGVRESTHIADGDRDGQGGESERLKQRQVWCGSVHSHIPPEERGKNFDSFCRYVQYSTVHCSIVWCL